MLKKLNVKKHLNPFDCFDRIPACDRHTDGQTEAYTYIHTYIHTIHRVFVKCMKYKKVTMRHYAPHTMLA